MPHGGRAGWGEAPSSGTELSQLPECQVPWPKGHPLPKRGQRGDWAQRQETGTSNARALTGPGSWAREQRGSVVTGGLGTCCHLFTLRPRDAPLQGPSCWEGTSSMLGPEAPRDEEGSSKAWQEPPSSNPSPLHCVRDSPSPAPECPP